MINRKQIKKCSILANEAYNNYLESLENSILIENKKLDTQLHIGIENDIVYIYTLKGREAPRSLANLFAPPSTSLNDGDDDDHNGGRSCCVDGRQARAGIEYVHDHLVA